MAKGKYVEWQTEEGLLQLGAWARDGLTDEQIASNIGISRSTLSDWKNRFSDIADTLKKGKAVVDIQVENALFKKAIGYKTKVKKAFKLKEVLYDNGKRLQETERIEYAEEEMYIPADTTAQIFWLKNRKPEAWKDKRDVSVDGEVKTNNPFTGLSTEELRKIINDE